MPSPLPALLLALLVSRPPPTAARPAPPSSPVETTVLSGFHRLLNAEPGRDVTGVSELKRYLNRFGYIPAGNFTDSFDAPLESAVARFQSKLGLDVTGRLNNQTLAQIISPRCGVGDNVTPGPGVSRFAFFPGQPRWARPRPMTLTYALSPTATIDFIANKDIHRVLRRAFDRWSRVIPVSFVESPDYTTANVKVGFYAGDHGDGEPFDGVLGVLAHAFSPESGRLHLDAAERWAVDFATEGSSVAVDLESVATHEIGHVLGLAHSSEREAVMYPSLSPRTRKVDLKMDDVEGAQALYGSNPTFSFSSLLESDTSSATPSARGRGRGRGYVTIGSIIVTSCIDGLLILVLLVLYS